MSALIVYIIGVASTLAFIAATFMNNRRTEPELFIGVPWPMYVAAAAIAVTVAALWPLAAIVAIHDALRWR